MFKFFTPTTKVQKDRAIMRETDARLAKYSRRGLIFNFIAFLLCLAGGDFVEREQGLAIVLTVGLLLATLLRGFFLFRFEALYPRAPTKWRNSYFLATLLGATWWGIILVSVTLVLQMKDVAPLLWLYTIVFFSTTAHAFAPYQRFLAIYQFVGQVPAAVAALFIPDINAYLYAVLLLAFYVMLTHQCKLMSEDYWQKLAATYALAKKTENLEEEKRGTRATVQLNQEFMNNLHADLGEVVQLTDTGIAELDAQKLDAEALQHLQQARDHQTRVFTHVEDFRALLSKDLVLQTRVFNARHALQDLVGEFVDVAAEQGIEIETALSPTVPMRLQGDAVRFTQIVRTLLMTATRDVSNCFILIEADFLREFETSGDLQVMISRQAYGRRRLFQAASGTGVADSLDLSVCKGLADSMDGALLVAEDTQGSDQIRFRAKFEVPDRNAQIDFHKDILAGHSILVVHHNVNLLEVKRRELDALGLVVHTESQYRRAYQTLVNSYRENNPIETVLFYRVPQSAEAIEFSESLLAHKELRHTHQLIACSSSRYMRDFKSGHSVDILRQPVGLYELGAALFQIRYRHQVAKLGAPRNVLNLLYVASDSDDRFVEEKLDFNGVQVRVIRSNQIDRQHLSEQDYALVLVACPDESITQTELVRRIRLIELEMGRTTLIPVIGVGERKPDEFYELGFDHFVEAQESQERLEATLRYWAEL